jgi:excisionase family DNA binding protein
MNTYTTLQAAEVLGIGRDTLYRWIRAKKIRPGKVTRVGNFAIRGWTDRDLARIRKYMRENYVKGPGRRKKLSR